uniref:Uncharacterized protein n=1 Tax=Panagrolaimus sp. JU765 TaxID=591449 RepID=A0AC34QUR8_9BILA
MDSTMAPSTVPSTTSTMPLIDDLFIDPYVILKMLPDSIDSKNQNVTLKHLLDNVPAKQSIDQIVKLTEWFTPNFSHYQPSVAPWIQTIISNTNQAKQANSRIFSTSPFSKNPAFIGTLSRYSQFLYATEQVMFQKMTPDEYLQGTTQLFSQLSTSEQQMFDQIFSSVYGYHISNVFKSLQNL